MTSGSNWSEAFIRQLGEKEMRDEFVADQVRTRLGLMIRALREQEPRGWSQKQLGDAMGKPQSVVSRLEDPEYGRLSVQTLLEVAAAFDLPLNIEFPEWGDWLAKIHEVEAKSFHRSSFTAAGLAPKSWPTRCTGNVFNLDYFRGLSVTGSSRSNMTEVAL